MPARVPRRRLKRTAAVVLAASSILLGGAATATGQESPGVPEETPSPTPATRSTVSPSPVPDATKAPTTHRLRARVRPGPSATFGAPLTFPDAMGVVLKGGCQQARNVVWDGDPKVSRVKVKVIRQEGDSENAWAGAPSGSCAAKHQNESPYKVRAKVSYPTPSGDRVVTGRKQLGTAFSILADRINAMRDKVLKTGNAATFTLKLIRVRKPVPGMIGGLARRYSLSVTKSLSVAKCESGYNPKAYNPAGPWAGVYQQDTDYWPQRSKKFGHPGESVFDAYANIDVSLKMARSMGWSHWACA